MRKAFIAGNWKMYKTASEASALASALVSALAADSEPKVMIAPPFTALHVVREALRGSRILLGAQNAASEVEGAHTGEISPRMLKDAGVSVVILGHSERRHVYGETDALVNKKVKLALTQGLDVILCVGETLDERQSGVTENVVQRQTEAGLAGVAAAELGRVTVAYEPVWAIGTGKNATPQDADAVHSFLRSVVSRMYTSEAAQSLIIQYGGSVKPENIKDLMRMENIDGALVGGASLKAETFLPIVRY
ncbi:MAG TPA: triose-phosphate isomerase, partial [Spirochaetia bacterium]|nr:triose-phosphate isomerase [Spirochaetia bacterium]